MLIFYRCAMREEKETKERLTFVAFLSHFLFITDFSCSPQFFVCAIVMCACIKCTVHMYHFSKWHRLHSLVLYLSFLLLLLIFPSCFVPLHSVATVIFTSACDFKISSMFIQRFQFTFLYTCLYLAREICVHLCM